jgi:hypothetical protein
MNLPKELVVGYRLLCNSRLAKRKEIDEDALTHFEKILNNAQPKNPSEITMYNTIQFLFKSDRKRFNEYINTPRLICLILWTEPRAIAYHFHLVNIVYVKSVSDRSYSVTKSIPLTVSNIIQEHPLVKARRMKYQRKKDKRAKKQPPYESKNETAATETAATETTATETTATETAETETAATETAATETAATETAETFIPSSGNTGDKAWADIVDE